MLFSARAAHGVPSSEYVLEPLPVVDLAVALQLPEELSGDVPKLAALEPGLRDDGGTITFCDLDPGNLRQQTAASLEFAAFSLKGRQLSLNGRAPLLEHVKCALQARVLALHRTDEGRARFRGGRHCRLSSERRPGNTARRGDAPRRPVHNFARHSSRP